MGTLLVVACGLDVVGVAPPDGVTLDGSVRDATASADGSSSDAGPPELPPDCSIATCEGLTLAAQGWTQVAFGDATEACPGGFDTAVAVEDPKEQTGSCSCGACETVGTNCDEGILASRSGSTDACSTKAAAPFVRSNECKEFANTGWANTYASEIPFEPRLGTCRAPGVGVRERVDVTRRHVCTRRADVCEAALCARSPSLAVCLVAPGDVACPAELPGRVDKHLVGRDFAMACTDCSCEATATCGGELEWWRSNPNCNGPPTGVMPGNACVRVDSAPIASFRWKSRVDAQGCTDLDPPTRATVSLSDVQTVCCPREL